MKFEDPQSHLNVRSGTLAELQQLAASVQEGIEVERTALSRDVHDQVGSALTGIRLRLEAIAQGLPKNNHPARQEILDVVQMVNQTLTATREICTNLRPQSLDDLGLGETCRWYVDDWSNTTAIPARIHIAHRLPEPESRMSTDIFRSLQELLNNVVRHASATAVKVELISSAKSLLLRVGDNGRGFAPNNPTRGFGLLGVRERARRHDGRVGLTTSANGTVVTVTLSQPMPA